MKPSTRKLHYPLPQSDIAIGADSLSWFVARRNRFGVYRPFAWYPNITQATHRAHLELVLDADPDKVETVIAACKDAIKRLTQALAPQFKVVV